MKVLNLSELNSVGGGVVSPSLAASTGVARLFAEGVDCLVNHKNSYYRMAAGVGMLAVTAYMTYIFASGDYYIGSYHTSPMQAPDGTPILLA